VGLVNKATSEAPMTVKWIRHASSAIGPPAVSPAWPNPWSRGRRSRRVTVGVPTACVATSVGEGPAGSASDPHARQDTPLPPLTPVCCEWRTCLRRVFGRQAARGPKRRRAAEPGCHP
jgi:hypothetical protein